MTRSLHPIIKFFTNIWNDWTLLTFGMFGFMPLLVAISFDEMDRLFSLYFMIILTIVMSGAAWFYMRAETHRQRMASLLIGILSTTAIGALANQGLSIEVPPADYYWGRSAYLRDPDGHQVEITKSGPGNGR